MVFHAEATHLFTNVRRCHIVLIANCYNTNTHYCSSKAHKSHQYIRISQSPDHSTDCAGSTAPFPHRIHIHDTGKDSIHQYLHLSRFDRSLCPKHRICILPLWLRCCQRSPQCRSCQVVLGDQTTERKAPKDLRMMKDASTLPKDTASFSKALAQSALSIKSSCRSM